LLVLDNLESVLQDEGYRDFLQRWLGACHQTEILVTTQVAPPLVQENPTELALGGLSPTEGAKLLQELAVGGTEADLQEFVEQVNGHPLTLKLVAGLLHEEFGDEATIGQLAGLGLADVGMLMSQLRGVHRQEVVQLLAVLDASFNRLSEKWRRLLLSLVVLRQAFDGTWASAMMGETVAPKELRRLAKRGFLLAEAQGYRFLPLIEEYLKFRLGDLREAHLRAIRFYLSRVTSRAEWETLEDVQEYLEVFYHRCELGEYEAAFDVIRCGDKVTKFLDLRGNNQLLAELYQQLVEHLSRREDWRYMGSLIGLGNAYYFLGRYQEAIACHEQSLQIARDIGNREGEAASLCNFGNAYDGLGRYQEAIACHEQSLQIKRDIGDRAGEAASLCNLGNAYDSLGCYQKAIVFYKQSLQISREMSHQRWKANSLSGLGKTYKSLGRYKDAIDLYKQSLKIQREIGHQQGEANSLKSLGDIYNTLENYEEAIRLVKQSLEIERKTANKRGEANSLINLGSTYYYLGSYREAISFTKKSLEIQREISNKRGEANSLSNLGDTYNTLGNYGEAIAVLEQSLEIQREIGDQGGEAASLCNLGNAYHSLGRYQEAITVREQSLDIARDIGDRKTESTSLGNLGNAYYSLGRYQEAITVYKQCLEIERDIGNRRSEAIPLTGLGNAYNALGHYQEAIAVYEQSLEIKRNIGDKRGEARTLGNLANSYQKVGRVQEGFAASQQATAIYQDLNLPLDAYPYPKWLKKLVKFAQRGKFHLILCCLGGLIAFPLVLIGFISLILYRLIRHRFNPHS
jgi:tetratricopeptide (TPR) repeat protein